MSSGRNSGLTTDSKLARKAATPSSLEKNINRKRGGEVSLNSFAFLFSEIILYSQNRVLGIQDLEQKLGEIGYRVGIRVYELTMLRERVIKRETRVINVLLYINSVVWKFLFGKPADSLEKSTENKDEYMITDNEPLLSKFISVPKEMASFSPCSFVAGIVEAILDSCQCPARVTAHTVPVDGKPHRTVILMKIDKSVLAREERLDTSK
ncbi:hypothetical protein BB559_003087 [Furculomyces boomerangus]|uniref:Trafficking protein particle complex subunit n=2 Tax=Harpellales TaxID=61421 RepID=A0A2T9YP61_9FUNG|nr:hypothetical protein BB559_003087 [Furculomyces boomerangus]PVZ96654.1 hypothetical protein BB558_007424 [Smittium angustum]PVZ99713.1 hypothetical protein BB558_004247 [Smittium angustum]